MAERTDTERIDYMENSLSWIMNHTYNKTELDLEDGSEIIVTSKIRQAIDAAMDREAEDAKQD